MQQPSTSSSERMIGRTLSNQFRLVRLLGEGGMGAVFEADALNGEGKRAIKILHPEYVDEPEVLQRFYAEAETAKRLDHPNIARVFDLATAEDGTPYLVMELLEGIPLSAYVRPGVPHPVQRAAPIIHAILQALTEAHRRGVVHRDLKPENVFLVRQETGQFAVKVLDFGIAKVMDAAGGMGSKTRTGVLLGTPGYMSPEQLKNAKTVDPRSDLWSVGIMLYEMLTGREAFEADTDFGRLTAVLTQDPVPVDKTDPKLAPFREYFMRALARDLDSRFQDAEEMANALLALARGGVPQPTAARSKPQDTSSTVLSAKSHGPVSVAPASQVRPSPQVAVVSPAPLATAAEAGPKAIAPWMLAVATSVALVLGFVVGFLVGRG